MWILGIIVLLPTLFLWVYVIAVGGSQHDSDAAGKALAGAFVAIAGILLWVLLTLLLLVGEANGGMPSWGGLLAIVFVPASGWGLQVALSALALNRRMKWPIVVPVAMPGLIIGYAAWSFFPSSHGTVGEGVAGLVAWGGVALLLPLAWIGRSRARTLSSLPTQSAEELAETTRQQEEAYKKQIADSFHALTTDSSLQEWWQYTEKESAFRQEAMEGARTAKNRQGDVAKMLCDSPMSLFLSLPRLDVVVTPELEVAVRKYLMKQVTSLMPYDPSRTITTKVVTEWYEQYFPTIRWFVDNAGSCDAELEALRNAVMEYPDGEERVRFFSALEGFKKGSAAAT